MQLEAFFSPFLQAPLFAGLPPQQLKTLALGCERRTFAPGDTLIYQGEAGDAAYLIVEGAVVRVANPLGAVGREEYGAGTLIGELAMLVETEHSSTVVAISPVSAIRLSRAQLSDLFAADPDLAGYFASRINDRLDDMVTGLNQIAAMLRDDSEPELRTEVMH